MPAALAFIPVAIGAMGVGGIAAFAATGLGMLTIAGAAFSAVGMISGNQDLAKIGGLVGLAAGVGGIANAAAGAAGADSAAKAAMIDADSASLAQSTLSGADPAAQTIASTGSAQNTNIDAVNGGNTSTNAVNGGDMAGNQSAQMPGQTAVDAARTGQSQAPGLLSGAERPISMPEPTWSGTAAQPTLTDTISSGFKDFFSGDKTKGAALEIGGKALLGGFGYNAPKEANEISRERLALESRLTQLKEQELANKNSSAGVNLGVSANTAATPFTGAASPMHRPPILRSRFA